jgi:hypothetical protein
MRSTRGERREEEEKLKPNKSANIKIYPPHGLNIEYRGGWGILSLKNISSLSEILENDVIGCGVRDSTIKPSTASVRIIS